MSPPYKSSINQWYTVSLFWDKWIELPIEARPINPVFTLYDDKPNLINARTTFVELNDPTGWLWAHKYLGSWDHWQKLIKCKWFIQALDTWQSELRTKLKQLALEKLIQIATGDSPQALQAAKYLAAAEWESPGSKRGRPSKEEIKGELANAVRTLASEEDDLSRIGGLTVIQGGKGV